MNNSAALWPGLLRRNICAKLIGISLKLLLSRSSEVREYLNPAMKTMEASKMIRLPPFTP